MGNPERFEEDGGGVGGGCSVDLLFIHTVSRLVQAQEDYIWRGIRFLKTKGCVFRLLPILPLRFFCSRVANVFTGDAGRVFLISSPLSLGDFLCIVVSLLFVCVRACVKKSVRLSKNERKMCRSICARMYKFHAPVCALHVLWGRSAER